MAPHTLAGYLALVLSTLAIVLVLRQQAPRWLLQPQFSATSSGDNHVRQLYLHTVKHSVTGILLQTPGYGNFGPRSKLKEQPYDHDKRMVGSDWPASGECTACSAAITGTMLCNLLRRHIHGALLAL
jgi:hypothetical protein